MAESFPPDWYVRSVGGMGACLGVVILAIGHPWLGAYFGIVGAWAIVAPDSMRRFVRWVAEARP